MVTDGDIEACFRSQYTRLVGVVAVVTGSSVLAEEAVQEAFARALDRTRRRQTFEHLPGWVVTVALNLARTGRRRATAEQRALDRHGSDPESQDPAKTADSLALRAAIAGLARRQQQAVVLYYLLDLDVATVAATLRVSDGTVKTALSRARSSLQASLGEREMET